MARCIVLLIWTEAGVVRIRQDAWAFYADVSNGRALHSQRNTLEGLTETCGTGTKGLAMVQVGS